MTFGDESFREHVFELSSSLRKRYGLVTSENVLENGSTVLLRNDICQLSFFSGWPRDPFVETSISYHEDDVFRAHGRTKSIEIWRYAEFRRIDRDQFYPAALKPSGGGRYSFIASPFQILADIIFLSVHCHSLLEIDRDVIRQFGEWFREKCEENTRTK